METSNTQSTTDNNSKPEAKAVKPDFGNGRYSSLMSECYRDLQSKFGLEASKAEKVARQIGSDYGAEMRFAEVTTKIGKSTKDGKVTLSEAGKVKGASLTYPLLAMRALQWIAEAGKNGVSWGETQWKPSKPLTEYFESL